MLGGPEEDSGGTITKYYSAAGLPSAKRVGTGFVTYLASDRLGSVSEALDGSGQVLAAQLYAPYGGLRDSSRAMPTSKGFTGQRADSLSGLDYYGARYYDAVAGQFTSADTQMDGLSPYAYVRGYPETFADPSGHRHACPDNDCGSSGGGGNSNGAGNGSGSGSGDGSCDSVDTCAKVKYPEGAPGSPCTNATGVCGFGSDPDGLFRFLLETDGQGNQGFILVGQGGITTFLKRLANLQGNVDSALTTLQELYGGGAIASGLAAAIKQLAKFIPPEILAVLFALGAGKVVQFQVLKERIDNMIENVEFQLNEIKDAMQREADQGAHTAIVVSTVDSGFTLLGPNPGDADYMAWETESIKVTDVIVWN